MKHAENALIHYVRTQHGIIIAELTAQRILAAYCEADHVIVKGRDPTTGQPRTVLIPSDEIQYAAFEGRADDLE